MGYQQQFRVWRGDSDGGDFAEYDVEVNEGEVVLDVIHRLQATQTPDLAVRWNCKAGKCGSCSAEINGRPRLLCMTRMSTLPPESTVTITPMRTFPVIRDLVTDVSFNYEKAREVRAFVPPADLEPGDYRMQQVDVERSQEFRKCIECFLCQDTCHVVRDHEENKVAFSGPRFLMRIAELDMHPLDAAQAEEGLDRQSSAQDQHGLGYCNITKCCTEVCPEHIKITDNALIPLKERVVDLKFDPMFIRRRTPSPAKSERDAQKAQEAEGKTRRAAEKKQHVEEEAQRDAEAKEQRDAEKSERGAEKARHVEEKAQRDAEAKAQRDAERSDRGAEKARQAEEKAQRDAEAKAQRDAEKSERGAEKARQAEEKAQRDAEAKAQRDAERSDRGAEKARQAEEKAQRDAEAKAQRDAEKARKAEEKAQRKAQRGSDEDSDQS